MGCGQRHAAPTLVENWSVARKCEELRYFLNALVSEGMLTLAA